MVFFLRLGKQPWFILLLPVFHVLRGVSAHPGFITLLQALCYFAGYIIVSVFIYYIAFLVSRSRQAAIACTFLLSMLFLYWVPYLLQISRLFPTGGYGWLLAGAGVIIILFLAFYCFKRLNGAVAEKWYLWANLLLLISIAFKCVTLISHTEARPEVVFQPVRPDEKPIKTPVKKPNIYLLLFDEYASSQRLKENWNFDNSPQDSFLRSKGFYVTADARSSYLATHFSVSSILNMDYIRGLEDSVYVSPFMYKQVAHWIDTNRLMRELKSQGYGIHNLSLFNAGGVRNIAEDLFIPSGWDILHSSTLYYPIFDRLKTFCYKLTGTTHNPGQRDHLYFHYYNQMVTDKITSLIGKTKAPAFYYTHILLPHAPLYYDSAGNVMPIQVTAARLDRSDTKAYTYNVQQANRIMRQIVTDIRVKDSNAVIIVTGDHGRRQYPGPEIEDISYNCYLAYYFPDGDYAYPASTPPILVNTFRIVLNKCLGYRLPMLPYRRVRIIE